MPKVIQNLFKPSIFGAWFVFLLYIVMLLAFNSYHLINYPIETLFIYGGWYIGFLIIYYTGYVIYKSHQKKSKNNKNKESSLPQGKYKILHNFYFIGILILAGLHILLMDRLLHFSPIFNNSIVAIVWYVVSLIFAFKQSTKLNIRSWVVGVLGALSILSFTAWVAGSFMGIPPTNAKFVTRCESGFLYKDDRSDFGLNEDIEHFISSPSGLVEFGYILESENAFYLHDRYWFEISGARATNISETNLEECIQNFYNSVNIIEE